MRHVLAILALTITPALAQQPPCAPHAIMTKMLADKYKEQPAAMGISGDSVLFELFKSEAGTWTATITKAHGLTCVVSAGTDMTTFKTGNDL